MKKLGKIVKRYLFFLFLLLINVLLLIVEPRLGQKVVSLSMNNLLQMLSIIPPIFLLLGLMDVWVPKETIMKFMGKDAGINGKTHKSYPFYQKPRSWIPVHSEGQYEKY